MSRVVLKPGKEKSLIQRHPWIFSGAIASRPVHTPGEILKVYSFDGKLLGAGYFHPENSIAGRMLTFADENPLDAIGHKLKAALDLRNHFVPTEARRLINAEGDDLPGLIVDQYGDVLVLQIHTAGMERLKSFLVDQLVQMLKPKAIYQKCTAAARRQEGLEDAKGLLYGIEMPEVSIEEHGISYFVSILEGQKTGFFLDQREMRKKILELSQGKKVLNCFAYTGGFSLAALKGGAQLVHSVEISEEACKLAHRNNFDPARHKIFQADAFEFLRSKPLDYDMVILDPPAFAKKRSDVTMAAKGYREINRLAIQKMPKGSLLLTCSCSSYIDPSLFQQLIFQSAFDAQRTVRILGRHIQAADHPVSIYHPEGVYLKSLLLYIY
jgi:23S rRNA (cytosine1962-C5)-methyltransferase